MEAAYKSRVPSPIALSHPEDGWSIQLKCRHDKLHWVSSCLQENPFYHFMSAGATEKPRSPQVPSSMAQIMLHNNCNACNYYSLVQHLQNGHIIQQAECTSLLSSPFSSNLVYHQVNIYHSDPAYEYVKGFGCNKIWSLFFLQRCFSNCIIFCLFSWNADNWQWQWKAFWVSPITSFTDSSGGNLFVFCTRKHLERIPTVWFI